MPSRVGEVETVRWRDMYIGLMAMTFAFGGLVLRAEGAPWVAVIPVWIVSLATGVIMIAHAGSVPKVLVVNESRARPEPRLHDELDEAGFAVVSCGGPEARGGCPVLAGEPCPFAGRHPVAAVIFAGSGEVEMLPPCGPALSIPVVALAEGSREGMSFSDTYARVGWDLGPQEAVLALGGLLSDSARPVV